MRDEIAYFYHLYPEKVMKKGNVYSFSLQGRTYYLCPYTRTLEEVEAIFLLNQSLTKQNIFFPKIIKNVGQQVLTYMNGKYYLLKEEILPTKTITYDEVAYQMQYVFPLDRIKTIRRDQWTFLWEKKIDYFEYQRQHIYQKFPILSKNLDYFIGLAENAISYVKNIEKVFLKTEKDALTVTRRRVQPNDDFSAFYDPLSFVIDHKARDIAEYIKACFFQTDISEVELESWIEKTTLSPYGWGLFLGRMLFPSYFFDLYEAIVNGKEKEQKIEKILCKAEAYREFLAILQDRIREKSNIPIIRWLGKKKEAYKMF